MTCLSDYAAPPFGSPRKPLGARFGLSRPTIDLRVGNPTFTDSIPRDLCCAHVGFGSHALPQLKTRHLWGIFGRAVERDFAVGGGN